MTHALRVIVINAIDGIVGFFVSMRLDKNNCSACKLNAYLV